MANSTIIKYGIDPDQTTIVFKKDMAPHCSLDQINRAENLMIKMPHGAGPWLCKV